MRQFDGWGLHVAHVVVDGGIDGDRLHNYASAIIEERGEDGLLGIDAIAETYWRIHRQARSAWTHEIDLRHTDASVLFANAGGSSAAAHIGFNGGGTTGFAADGATTSVPEPMSIALLAESTEGGPIVTGPFA